MALIQIQVALILEALFKVLILHYVKSLASGPFTYLILGLRRFCGPSRFILF